MLIWRRLQKKWRSTDKGKGVGLTALTKNWLFSASVAGAKASANLYSLIETAKANGLEPYVYLRHVFAHLPRATSVEDMEALLPWKVDLQEAVY